LTPVSCVGHTPAAQITPFGRGTGGRAGDQIAVQNEAGLRAATVGELITHAIGSADTAADPASL